MAHSIFTPSLEEKIKENVAKCCYRVKGTFKHTVDLVASGVVPPDAGQQGDCSVCWAWGSTLAVRCALHVAGKDVPELSVQHVIDHTYPKRPRCSGGHVVSALEHIKRSGVPEAGKYMAYTGLKNMGAIKSATGEFHFIDDWRVLPNVESEMSAVLKQQQAIIVSIPYAPGVVFFTGEGLLDPVKAEKYHDPSLMSDMNSDEITAHSVLLVGEGVFTPDPLLTTDFPSVEYWIVKNQWGIDWALNGIAFIIKNSSLVKIEELKLNRALTPVEIDDLTWSYAAAIPVCYPKGSIPPALDIVKKSLNAEEMIGYITKPENEDVKLIYLLYDGNFRNVNHCGIEEEFEALARVYEHEEEIIIAMFDLSSEKDASRRFGLRVRDKMVLWAFMPKKGRTLKDALTYNGEYIFGDMLFWLGETVNMGRGYNVWIKGEKQDGALGFHAQKREDA